VPKVAIIGAGSHFTVHLATDILLTPGIGPGEFALVDPDAERLGLVHKLLEKIAAHTHFAGDHPDSVALLEELFEAEKDFPPGWE